MPLLSIITKYKIPVLSVICLLNFGAAYGSSSPFSVEEQQALNKFRPLVEDALYQDYMQEDAYLIPWLSRSKLDAKQAEKALRKAHQWRKDNKIDTIATEDYSKLEQELPYFIDAVDLEGRPVLTFFFGTSWDLRKQILSGHRIRVNLYATRMYEIAASKARQGFNSSEGRRTSNRNIPDWMVLVDFHKYNLKQHGCLPCVPVILRFATDWDSYFPTMTSAIIVNAPKLFDSILQLVRPLLDERANKALQVFGLNKQEWSAFLLKQIPADQLRRSFGGTKI